MKRLFFIDIDGTLLDENYRANSDTVRDTIERLQQKGIVFALNSNRALADMLPVARQFGIDGPLVSENGVFYATQNDSSMNMLVSEEWALKLRNEKREFETELKKHLYEEYGDGFVWETVDTVRFLSNPKLDIDLAPGTLFFANNKHREFTTSVHVFEQTVNGLEHVNAVVLDTICGAMKHWCDDNDMFILKGYEFTNILAHTKHYSKHSAVEALRKIYNDTSFCAIGNEDSDADMIRGVGKFYAVANAMTAAKEAAAYVAKHATTEGVNEILKLVESDEL